MQGNYRFFLPLLIALLLTTACRYEDGPLISFRSETRRLVRHVRTISHIERFGQDLTPEFNRIFPNSDFHFTEYEYNGWAVLDWNSSAFGSTYSIQCGYITTPVKDQDRKTYLLLNLMGVDSLNGEPGMQDLVGWEAIHTFEEVLFPVYDSLGSFHGKYPRFEITKLTNAELQLKSACFECDLGHTYRIHFKQKSYSVP